VPKFRKKPVVVEVEARQFDPAKPHSQWPLFVEWEPEFLDQDGSRLGGFYKLKPYAGFDFINAGDWVVYAKDGPRVIKNKDFRASYEPVEEQP
jgi:hypothetical protein